MVGLYNKDSLLKLTLQVELYIEPFVLKICHSLVCTSKTFRAILGVYKEKKEYEDTVLNIF